MFISIITSRLRGFARCRDGVATEWSIMWTVIFLIFGGLAIDTAYALRTHQLLQASADAASAAGAVQLWEGGAVDTEAIQYSRYNMPRGLHGNVLLSSDVFTGTWDHTTKVFTPTSVNPDAVKVQTRRMASNGNALPTVLLGLIGFDKFNIASESVTHLLMNPACLDNGIIANGTVNLASNNIFDQFCVHGYQGVDLQMGSTFGSYTGPDGTPHPIITVGHPYDGSGNVLPMDQWLSGANYNAMMANNPGLPGNFGTRPGFKSRAAQKVATYINDLYDPNNPDPNFTVISGKPAFDALNQDAMNGSYYVTCGGGQRITIDPPSTTLSNVTIVTTCKVAVSYGVTLASVILATTSAATNAVTMADGVNLGGDVCDALSGNLTGPPQQSDILAMGDIHAASDIAIYGSKIISAANVHFAARNGGINGASIQADGDVFLASLSDYSAGPCKVPLDENFLAPYWRIVR